MSTQFHWSSKRHKAALALAEGQSQQSVAEATGVCRKTICNWLCVTEFATEVDRLSCMIDISSRAERLRMAMRMVRQKVHADGTVETDKDVLDWLKFAQSETTGIKLGFSRGEVAEMTDHPHAGKSIFSVEPNRRKRVQSSNMTPRVKTGPSRWLQVRALIFGLAVFNFALVWTLDQRMGGIAALVDPWYHPWSYFNEPSRLLVAASLLAMGRAWSDLAAVSLSAYMVIRFIHLFAVWNGTWQWSFLSKYEPYFVGSYESQYLLALVILCVGVFLFDGGDLASKHMIIAWRSCTRHAKTQPVKRSAAGPRIAWRKESGIHPSVLSKYVNNQVREISLDTLNMLCEALTCRAGDLVEYVPDSKHKARKQTRHIKTPMPGSRSFRE